MKTKRVFIAVFACVSVLIISVGFALADDTSADDWVTSGDTYLTSGKVGIGSTSPETTLHIKSGTTATELKIEGSSGTYLNLSSSGTGINTISAVDDGSNTALIFETTNSGAVGEVMRLTNDGKIGIGTTNPGVGIKLDIVGKARAHEIIVNLDNPADFVFQEGYNLPTLKQVESFIKKNKHLPDIPSTKEVKENGIGVSEMMSKQMQKIEELTLYVIDQNKEIQSLKKELAELKERK